MHCHNLGFKYTEILVKKFISDTSLLHEKPLIMKRRSMLESRPGTDLNYKYLQVNLQQKI